jgi:hypothetical protein
MPDQSTPPARHQHIRVYRDGHGVYKQWMEPDARIVRQQRHLAEVRGEVFIAEECTDPWCLKRLHAQEQQSDV